MKISFGKNLGACVLAALGLLATSGTSVAQLGNNCTYEGPFYCSQRFPNQAPNEYVGRKVAVEGDVALISAITAGRLYVTNFNTGEIMLTIDDPDAGTTDRFGYSVSMDGNQIAVGDSRHMYDSMPGRHGQVSIFEINVPSPLGATDTLAPPTNTIIFDDPTDSFVDGGTPVPLGEFGHDVGIAGNLVIVGEPFHTTALLTTPEEGAAHLFVAGNNNAPLQSFQNPFPSAGDLFGSYVAIEFVPSNVLIAISAHQEDFYGENSGLVYLYDATSLGQAPMDVDHLAIFPRPQDFGELTAMLPQGADLTNIKFGQDSDLDGGRLLVSFTGGAILYDLNQPGYPIIATFDHPVDTVEQGLFLKTQTAALSGDLVVIGTPAIYDPLNSPKKKNLPGSMRIYNASNGQLIQEIFDPTLQSNLVEPEQWTNSVAIDGDNVLAGSILANNVYNGEVNLFRKPVLGDCNFDGVLDLLDVGAFNVVVGLGNYLLEADINLDGAVNLLDVQPFIDLLSGN